MKYILSLLFFTVVYSTKSQVYGCTDPSAINYTPSATINDGSCMYSPTSLTPFKTILLPSLLKETSGLFLDKDSLWTHNDDSDINLYKCSINDSGYTKYPLSVLKNTEWEDISSDSIYLYIGDFGNNSSGNRKDLHILRIEKSSLLQGKVKADTIHFSYEDQVDLKAVASNTTDFDCEAMIIGKDSIYLFSKMWTLQKTIMYSLPKLPGLYIAKKKAELDVQGLISGACFLEDKKLIILCGYSPLLQPFLYYIYDYPLSNVNMGNKRKVTINLPFHQIEGITTADGLNIYCTNERFSQSFITIPQALHHIDNRSIIQAYLSKYNTSIQHKDPSPILSIIPFTSEQSIIIHSNPVYIGKPFTIFSYKGEHICSGHIENELSTYNIKDLSNGLYIFSLDNIFSFPFTIMH
jgi:hypothetical protein